MHFAFQVLTSPNNRKAPGSRIIIVVKLDVLQSECDMIGTPKIYEEKIPEGQGPYVPANSAQAK